jgi:hypothetical protein
MAQAAISATGHATVVDPVNKSESTSSPRPTCIRCIRRQKYSASKARASGKSDTIDHAAQPVY